MKTLFRILSFSLFALIMVSTKSAQSQSALDQLNNVNNNGFQGEGGSGNTYTAPSVSAPTPVQSSSSSSSSSSNSTSNSLSTDVAGMVMQGLINSMFSSDPKAEQAKLEAEKLEQARIAAAIAQQKKTSDSLAQIKHDELMQKIKPLSTDNGNMDLKTIDGDAVVKAPSTATNFFGIALSDADINTLINSENDPMIVDLRNAQSFIVGNLKTEATVTTTEAKKVDAEKKPETLSPECLKIKTKLDGFIKNRENFQKTINLTQTELSSWEEQNDKAFWNAVKDGIGSTSGLFIDYVKETRSSAGMLKKNIELLQDKLIKDKVFTPAEISKYKSILDARMLTYDVSELASNFKDVIEYYDAVVNTMRAALLELSKTNSDYAAMYEDPRFIESFSAFPKVELSQFLSSKALQTFLVDPLIKKGLIKKLPYVGIAQLAVSEIYNATDWITSYYTTCKLNDADGKATEAAKYLQQKIIETQDQLDNCK
jgi:hypothetical protein